MGFGIGEIVGAATGSSLLAGGAGLIGGLYQNHSAELQAEWQRDWEKMMSDTSHRREVADLKAAGLNPLLSVNKGASTPSTSVAPVSDPVQAGINSALAVRSNRADVDLKEASAANMRKQNEMLDEQIVGQVFENQIKLMSQGKIPEEIENLIVSRSKSITEQARIRQEIKNLLVEEGILGSTAKLKAAEVPGAETEAAIDKSEPGKIGRILKRITDIFGKPGREPSEGSSRSRRK